MFRNWRSIWYSASFAVFTHEELLQSLTILQRMLFLAAEFWGTLCYVITLQERPRWLGSPFKVVKMPVIRAKEHYRTEQSKKGRVQTCELPEARENASNHVTTANQDLQKNHKKPMKNQCSDCLKRGKRKSLSRDRFYFCIWLGGASFLNQSPGELRQSEAISKYLYFLKIANCST